MAWPQPMPLVEVLWDDSMSHGGWQAPAAYTWGMACRSIGWLLERTPSHLVLLQSQNEHGQVAEALEIPRRAVRQVRVLERGQRRRTTTV